MEDRSAADRLKRQIDRERRARAEAEAIAERSTRQLYAKQQEVLLLQAIAVAANEASSVDDALQIAVDRVCEYTGWPVGHVYIVRVADNVLVPSNVWHLEDNQRFATFRRITEETPLFEGRGLPGRVLANERAVWIMDVTRDDNFPRAQQAKDIGVRAAFGFPVLAGTQVAAVLEFFAPEALEPDPRLLDVMTHVGTQLGRVIERKRAEAALRESEQRFRLLFERNLAGVYRTTVSGRLLECNASLARIMGYSSPQELLSSTAASQYVDPRDRERFLGSLLRYGIVTNFEVRLRRKDGVEVWVLENATLLKSDPGTDAVIEGTVIDITGRKEAEETIRQLAYHDLLTDLPNRALLKDRLALTLAQARRRSTTVALMFLDLDEFKDVNDSVGHADGDRLLRHVADRLKVLVREGDTIARLGGDEFTILLPDVAGVEDVAEVAARIIDGLRKPWRVGGREFRITGSVGITIYPDDGLDADTLLRNADTAMYRAKEQGRDQFQVYSPAMKAQIDARLTLETDLRAALRKGEFELHYQPQVDVNSGRVVGAEALVRWHHPHRGLVGPLEFIPAAEKNGLIVPLGEWVLRSACEQAAEWKHDGLDIGRIAVNLSARQFEQRDLVELVAQALHDVALDPHDLQLEITEGVAMRDAEYTVATLQRLRAMGVQIAIDDFGTGHSALSYLKRFPVDALKIDCSFLREVTESEADAALVTAICAIGHSLGLLVIAEGVETEEQLAFLRRPQDRLAFLTERSCDQFQGYLFSRPVPAAQMQAILAEGVAASRLDASFR